MTYADLDVSTAAATYTANQPKYDTITDDFLRWVREVPLESDAVANLPKCLKRYEDKKTFWQVFKQLLVKLNDL